MDFDEFPQGGGGVYKEKEPKKTPHGPVQGRVASPCKNTPGVILKSVMRKRVTNHYCTVVFK